MISTHKTDHLKEGTPDEPIIGGRFRRKALLQVTESSRIYTGKSVCPHKFTFPRNEYKNLARSLD